MVYDFTDLNKNQRRLLNQKGWSPEEMGKLNRPSPSDVEPLFKRGLLVAFETMYHGEYMDRYEVPLLAHNAWVVHCRESKVRA